MKFIKRSFMLMTMLIFLIIISLQVQASECTHVWGEWECDDYCDSQSICTKGGIMTRMCEKCYEFQTKSVSALGHKWGAWEYDNVYDEPTCTEKGTMIRICQRCDEEQTKSVPALGHEWATWEYFNEDAKPTCTEKGTMIRECRRGDCDEIQTKSISASGKHKWGKWKYDEEYAKPTCTEKGTMIRECQNCLGEQKKSVPALGHKWGTWGYDYDNEPTCTKKGTMTRNCQRLDCDKTQTKRTPALGHKWGKWKYDYNEDKPTCTKKGTMIRECQRKNCSGEQKKSTPALGHKWGKWHVDVEPTVLKAGKKSRICVRCKKGETNVINKLKGVYGKSSTINTYPEKKLNVSNIGLKGKKKYTSSNKKIATVNSRGIIQTKKAGKCKITVKSGKQSYKINLVVNKPVLNFESFIDDYDTRNNVFYVVITNNGTNNLKITSGIKVEEDDYKIYDRKISTKAVTIKPGAEKTIKFKVKGKVTWYDYEDFTLYYKIKYDGKTYTVGTDAEDSWLCKK